MSKFQKGPGPWGPGPFLILVLAAVLNLGAAHHPAAKPEVAKSEAKPEAAKQEVKPAPQPGEKSLVFKLMVVNPSDKYEQTYPIQAYLPVEIKAEDVLEKADLDLNYDADKKAFLLTREVKLKPGESIVKTIMVRDIWLISEDVLKVRSEEARDLVRKLVGSKYEEQAKLLWNNIEILLSQIFERQNDDKVTPEEHIAVYRANKRKLEDIDLDLMALRRLVVTAGGIPLPGLKKGSAPSLLANWNSEAKSLASQGAVPAWVLWKIIFAVLIFMGSITLFFVLVWQRQMGILHSRNRELIKPAVPEKKEEELHIGDFMDTDEKHKVA